MKITLNLATRPYADQGPALKQLRKGMMICGGLLVLLLLGLLHFHQRALKLQAQEDAAEASVTRVRQEQLGYRAQMQLPPNARVLQQAEFLNNLFAEKAFSWTAAMEDLERVLPAGEQVTAIEPSRGKDGRLTLKLRVSGQRERSVEMVRNMEHSQRFASPRVSGESAEGGNGPTAIQNASDAGKVNFDILAEYNPPTLEERRAEIAAQKNKGVGAVTPVPATAPVVSTPAMRAPRYIPPNPQPTRPQPGMRPVPGPGGVPQYMSPIRGQSPVQPFVPPNQQPNPQQQEGPQ
jgi:type IV pilus assembly protein PilN